MLKVLVVDDEFIVRVGLKSSINWIEYGFDLVGEASNGKEAINLIEKYSPDIVITDIKMPIIDGIELIKKEKKEKPEIEFIVLSCYDDFEIVKEAMKLGAHDYFIKLNMEPKELIKVLNDVKNKILEKNKKKADEFFIKRNMHKNLPVIKTKFFNDLVCGDILMGDEIKEKIKFLDINITEKNIVCLSILIDNSYLYQSTNKRDTHLTNLSILNIVEETLKDYGDGYAFLNEDARFGVIICYPNLCGKKAINEKVVLLSQTIRNMLEKYIEISVSIGISDIKNKIEDISKAYKEAVEASKYRYFKGKGSIIHISQIDNDKQYEKFEQVYQTEMLTDYLKDFDIEKIEQLFLGLLQYIKGNMISYEKAQMLCFSIAVQVINYLQTDQKYLEKYLDKNYNAKKEIEKLETLEDVENWIVWINKKIIKYINVKKENFCSKAVVETQNYIKENYDKSISLEDLAANINITSNYLSKLFKRETGQTLTSYLTMFRINKAKEYIKGNKMKMYEIAEAIGYQNTYYFSKVFKKVTGMSPAEYKQKSLSI